MLFPGLVEYIGATSFLTKCYQRRLNHGLAWSVYCILFRFIEMCTFLCCVVFFVNMLAKRLAVKTILTGVLHFLASTGFSLHRPDL